MNKEERNSINIEVNITEKLILTPLACASIINKLIKCLIYEKFHIPYSYEILKAFVKKRRERGCENEEECDFVDSHLSYKVDRHFQIVSNAYDTIELLLRQVRNQFRSGACVQEVMFLFGGSEMSPKEVYRILIPEIPHGHFENNHLSCGEKLSRDVLRQILLSDSWRCAVSNTLPPTNMFTLVRTSGGDECVDQFTSEPSFYLSANTRKINIKLLYEQDTRYGNCCSNMLVFEDEPEINDIKKESSSGIQDIQSQWYQADAVLKGFKETYVNKVPLSQLF